MHEEQWLHQLLRLREEICSELSDLHDGRVVRHSDPASEEAQLLKELAVRRLLGGLRSACILIEPIKGSGGVLAGIQVRGAGFGHGVGMCQSGAQAMAKAGRSHKQILPHYFPGSRIVAAYRTRAEEAKFSHRASLSEIAGNDYNLNIPRYVDTFEAEA